MKRDLYRRKRKDKFVTFSVFLLFGSLLLAAFYLGYKSLTVKNNQRPTGVGFSNKNAVQLASERELYSNPIYNFSLEVPRLLVKQNARNKDGYVFLMIFGENEYSKARGVAIGVGERTVEEEISQVKAGYAKDESAELVSEKEVMVDSEKGKQLSYKPKGDQKDLEAKDVVVVRHGSYTYTISTTPDQINHILQTFKFL